MHSHQQPLHSPLRLGWTHLNLNVVQNALCAEHNLKNTYPGIEEEERTCWWVISPPPIECRASFVNSVKNIEGLWTFLVYISPWKVLFSSSCSQGLDNPRRQHHVLPFDNHEADLVLSIYITSLLPHCWVPSWGMLAFRCSGEGCLCWRSSCPWCWLCHYDHPCLYSSLQ